MNDLTRYRAADVRALLERLVTGNAVAVVGLSNFGKSTLLRQLAEPQVARELERMTGRPALFVYVDCNRMLQMSAQGLYEAILRAVLETLEGLPRQRIEGFYEKVVESRSEFAIPLAFNDAMIALLDESQPPRDVILLLDEFDSVLAQLDERVFLNHRALKDKYEKRLNYVTATLQPPTRGEGGDDLAEFLELFGAFEYHLPGLDAEAATSVAAEIFEQANDHLDPHERDYILEQAGGHPGLLKAVSHLVLQVESGAPATYTQQALNVADDMLQNHLLVRGELAKLWKLLLPAEREATMLAATHGPAALSEAQRSNLLTRGLLVPDRTGAARLFSRLFAHFARRQGFAQQPSAGVWMDVDAGTVWVNGRPIEPLTDLEHRLLLLLYGRIGKICDKYQIVESVWGQDYLGEVDDARIEKLISRLRAKIEPDLAHPQFIMTVRGRGYKLSHPQGMIER